MTQTRETKHIILADVLRQAIQSGKLREGDQIPTESQLEATHSCSRGTVRRAIQTLAQEGLVVCRRGAGTFVCAQTRAPLLGVIVTNVHTPMGSTMVEVLEAAARASGCKILLLQSWNECPGKEKAFISELAAMNVAGILKMPTSLTCEREVRNHIRTLHLPYVILHDWGADRYGECHVGMDEHAAVEKALDHLVELGHQRIAFLRTENEAHPVARDLFLRGLAARGLPAEERQASAMRGNRDCSHVFLPEVIHDVTAVVAPHYSAALHVIHGLQELGLSVPHDRSLVSLGPLPDTDNRTIDITSTVPPLDTIAERAVQLVLEGTDADTVHYYYKPQLCVGETTTAPGAGNVSSARTHLVAMR